MVFTIEGPQAGMSACSTVAELIGPFNCRDVHVQCVSYCQHWHGQRHET